MGQLCPVPPIPEGIFHFAVDRQRFLPASLRLFGPARRGFGTQFARAADYRDRLCAASGKFRFADWRAEIKFGVSRTLCGTRRAELPGSR